MAGSNFKKEKDNNLKFILEILQNNPFSNSSAIYSKFPWGITILLS